LPPKPSVNPSLICFEPHQDGAPLTPEAEALEPASLTLSDDEEPPHALTDSATAPVTARRRRVVEGRDMRVDLSVAELWVVSCG
jgi:hypothetical protein